jgi:hypothetical protein
MRDERDESPTVESEPPIPAELDMWLDLADRDLTNSNTPIHNRPVLSIIRLLQWEAIMDANGVPYAVDAHLLVSADWFAPLAKMVGRWYRDRYGQAAEPARNDDLKAFVLIRGTPFEVHIPRHRTEPGEEVGTAWLHLMDSVRDDEIATDWIVKPPNLAALDSEAFAQLESGLSIVATDLRFIDVATISVPHTGPAELPTLLRAIVPHLNRAAAMVGQHQHQELVSSYWELQMAAESAVKALLLQKGGSFKKIHNLQALAKDAALADVTFPSNLLAGFPGQHEVIGMRYGFGDVPRWDQCFKDYCNVLHFIRSCLERMKRYGLGNASFLLKRPAWV